MKRKATKLLSLFLAIVFIVTLLPSFALAEGEPPVVAQIGSNKYTSLAEAVTQASAGATINLLADTEISEPINITKNLSIIGDSTTNPTITATGLKLFNVTKDNVKLSLTKVKMTCGNVDTDNGPNYFIQCGTKTVELNIENCEFTNNYYGFAGYKIFGSVTGCTFNGIFKNYIGGLADNGTLEISNNTFNAMGTVNPAIGSSAMQRSGSALDIDAGSSSNGNSLHFGSSGSIVISGNTFLNNGSTAADATGGNTTGAIKAKQRGLEGDSDYTAGGGFTLVLTVTNNKFYNNSRDIVLGTSDIAVTHPNTFEMSGNTAYSDANLTAAVPVTLYDFSTNNTSKQTDSVDTTKIFTNTVAVNGVAKYATLAEAVAAAESGATIKLLGNSIGAGIIVPSDKNFTLDFDNHTYTVQNDPLAGSTGTKSQCFQLLKGATVTMKNGAIVADNTGIAVFIQNYADLTLENMNLDATEGDNGVRIGMISYCGDVRITGDTSFKMKTAEQTAILTGWWPSSGTYLGGTAVNVNTTGTITGNIDFGEQDSENVDRVATTLTINNCILNGKVNIIEKMAASAATNVVVNGGTFSDMSWLPYVADGASVKLGADVTDAGLVVPSGSNFTLDFGGHTYTVDDPVGSTGTVRNGLQLLKDSTLIFKNGTINGDLERIRTVIQNYSDLTLEDMTITKSTTYTAVAGKTTRGICVDNGSVNIIGSTSINVPVAGGVAVEVCLTGGANYPNRSVTIDSTGSFVGELQMTHGATYDERTNSGSLTINKGAFSDLSGLPYVASGKTYTLGENYTLGIGKSAAVPTGVTLRIPAGVTLTNKGTITNTGAITVIGALTGNKVEGNVNGNAPVVETPKPVEVVAEVVTTINTTAAAENKDVINAAVAAVGSATDKTELTSNTAVTNLAKLEELYVAANTNIRDTKVTVDSEYIGGNNTATVKNAALSVADAPTTVTPTITIADKTLEEAETANIKTAVGAANGATVIPLEIKLQAKTSETDDPEAIQPKAPLVIKLQVNVLLEAAKKMVIAHMDGSTVKEKIIPTVSGNDTDGVYLEFVATSLSPFVLVETPVEQNPNAYTVYFEPTSTTATLGGTVTYDVYVEQTNGSESIYGLDLILDYNTKLTITDFTPAASNRVALKHITEDENTALNGKYKLQATPTSQNPWTPSGKELVGQLTFIVAADASGTAGDITALRDYSGITNTSYQPPAFTTLVTGDVTFVASYVTLTFNGGTVTVLYAPYGGTALYSNQGLTTSAEAPTVSAHTNKRLTDTANWYLEGTTATFASFTDGFTANQTFVPKEVDEYAITFTPVDKFTPGNGIVSDKVAMGVDASFSVAAPANGLKATVSYKVGVAESTPYTVLTPAEGTYNYTITGSSITGVVAVKVEYALNLTAGDIKIFTTAAEDAYMPFSTYAAGKTLVLIKGIDGVTSLAFTAEGAPTIFKTTAYEGYAYAVLVPYTDVATVSAAAMFAELTNLGLSISDTAVTLTYDWDTNGLSGARISDVQATYDFTTLVGAQLKWQPSDELLLKADVMTFSGGADDSKNAAANYNNARDGHVDPSDVNAFLYRYAQF